MKRTATLFKSMIVSLTIQVYSKRTSYRGYGGEQLISSLINGQRCGAGSQIWDDRDNRENRKIGEPGNWNIVKTGKFGMPENSGTIKSKPWNANLCMRDHLKGSTTRDRKTTKIRLIQIRVVPLDRDCKLRKWNYCIAMNK